MHDDAAYRESLSSSCHISPAKSRLIGVLTARQFGGYGFLAAHCTLLLTHTLPEPNRMSGITHEEPRHRPEQSGRTGNSDAEPVTVC